MLGSLERVIRNREWKLFDPAGLKLYHLGKLYGERREPNPDYESGE